MSSSLFSGFGDGAILAMYMFEPWLAGGPAGLPALYAKRDKLVESFRTGVGMPYDAYGAECACGAHRELVRSRADYRYQY